MLSSVFPGDSELSRLMRALDWSQTNLGAPERWSDPLRTAVSLCLTSRFPIVLYLGPEFTLLYNDAYIPFLGKTKHPRSLGQPGRECWPEIWDTIGPMLESVCATGKATWSEDVLLFFARNLPLEEVYVRFTLGPILGADGRTVEGIFNPCTETTEQVVGARRLETLRKLGASATQARGVEAACREAAAVLAENPRDVPFAALYLLDETGERATLQGSAGLPEGHPLPPFVSAGGAGKEPPGPLARVLRTHVSEEIGLDQFGGPLPGWPSAEPATRAIVLPLPASVPRSLAGLLLLGVSPRRVLDAGYRTFFDLVTGHIAAAIAGARAYETERTRAEALAALDRTKTAFFSNVSHEFRTPLTLILAPIEDAMATLSGSCRTEAATSLETARRNALRLLKLVNALLDFSRIEAGRDEASFEPTDLAMLTAELASVFRSAVERAGLTLGVHCEPLPEPVYVDRQMWEKIVLNLLSNAFKFTFAGGIQVTLTQEGDRIALRVRDSGIGIAPEELPRVWERFHRIEGVRARTHEGSGIGLALVRELVCMHHGAIHAESAPGVGTTFTVLLRRGVEHLPQDRIGAPRLLTPAATAAPAFVEEALGWLPPEVDEEGAAPPAEPGAGPSDELAGARILVADDNADMRRYLTRLLSRRWTVEAVADGEAALAAARRAPFDLILTDVMMPVLDGVGLLRALRASPALQAVPVIMLSARAGEESRVEGLEAGADDYLIKPFSAREVTARVEVHLKASSRRRLAAENAALSRLHEVSARLVRQDALPTLLEAIVDAAIAVGGGDMGNVQLYDVESGELRMVAHRGFRPPFLAYFGVLQDGAAACAQAMRLRRRVIVEDVSTSEIFLGTPAMAVLNEAGVRACQSTPLVGRSGSLLGVFSTHWAEPHRPDEGTLRVLDLLAREAADLIEHRQREEALRDADRRKDEFLAVLSHELRNPLAALRTSLYVHERASTPEQARRAKAVMGRQVDQLARLVDDLLDVTRISQNKIRLDRSVLDLDELARRTIEDHRLLFERSGVRLKQIPAPSPVLVDGDASRLAQALGNLLDNAAKFTPRGGVTRVHVLWHAATKEAILRVADSGVGMTKGELARVFQPFVQVDATLDRNKGGALAARDGVAGGSPGSPSARAPRGPARAPHRGQPGCRKHDAGGPRARLARGRRRG